MVTITVDAENAGVRLDRYLRKRLPLLPLSRIYSLIRHGDVRIDGGKVSQSRRLNEGEVIELRVSAAELRQQRDNSGESVSDTLTETGFFRRNFRILHEDDALIVCNKPEGLVVHAGTGHADRDTLIDMARSYMLRKRPTSGAIEPDLAHRLDRDTSGVILIAKNKRALRPLNEELRLGHIAKDYIALCHGRPQKLSGTISVEMVRTFGKQHGTKMKVEQGGAATATSYEVEESHGGISRLRIRLHTGKTHQIRVHLTHIGNPIVGDVRYGNAQLDKTLFSSVRVKPRLYLHAWRLSFTHPVTGKPLTVTAPLPEDFTVLMRQRNF